ncbi:kinase-associated lipoprotein B [Paenibacillus sp. J2TS4]|uniref:kinase-associated lipoprotein B n=1 Tax=Paenibacillus sp. J2TS4 TaxID=2807194 RepID=UPI001B2CA3CD|nr:kinase-associated lipoprotein B [Paenibacillus sp. J2TS4]GIP32696.1 kinase-associated protein B [Paenibacillus sp. J2TS4]
MSDTYQVGEIVQAEYKTGKYVGKIVEWNPNGSKAAVQVLAVLNHPMQGNLHHPMNPDVSYFHQRRALANQEIALMPLETLQAYSGPIPEYEASLKEALRADIEALTKSIRFSEKCLSELHALQKEYFPEQA